jgi:dTDP-4-dehydrorhamnose reductase
VRILITGASGLLGGRLAALLSPLHETTGVVRFQRAPEGVATIAADLTDEEALHASLERVRPDAVIHCAALGEAEVCEREPERARRENVIVPRNLAAACQARGARLVSLSTDLVFGGGVAFSREDAPTHPLTEYGRSKLAGEEASLAGSSDHVVLRVALVSGRGHGRRLTASEAVAQKLRGGEPITLFEDEWRTPVDPESVAAAIAAVLKRPGLGGRFHIAGAERVTRVELGERTARILGLDASLIRRAPQSSHRGAPRPADVSLDITRARAELDWSPRPFDQGLREGR